jgi:hypothetical protein
MIDILDVPAERDLPPGHAVRMRAALVTATAPRRPRPVRLRVAVAAATVAALAVGGVALVQPSNDSGKQTLAFGPDELSPTLLHAVEQCVQWTTPDQSWPVSMTDLAVAAERDGVGVVLFMSTVGYVTCQARWDAAGQMTGGAAAFEAWPQRDWLPGPVDRLLLTSTEADGGDVTVTGRVSARVRRLVLEHGDGNRTTARLVRGAFGLLTVGAKVKLNAQLVSYDADGREIDRRPLFEPFDRLGRCYVDPSGTVVYGKPGPTCQPADPWTR